MDQLSKEEKYFVSCFVEQCDDLLMPKLGKIFSLHTFIENGRPHQKQQEKRRSTTDPYIAERLRLISDRVDDEVFYNKQIRKLKREGCCTDEIFENNFRAISDWLWLVESDRVRARVRRAHSVKSKDLETARIEKEIIWKKISAAKLEEENKRFELNKTNNSTEESKLQIALSRIRASGGAANVQKISKLPPGTLRPTDSQVCFICNGFGKTTANRYCQKCSGRGFIRN